MTAGPAEIPVFILCGGLGTRLREETEFRPKPMVEVGSHPLLWHVMSAYGAFGFRRFVLCMGYKHEVIRQYFLNFYAMNSDATVHLATNEVTVHSVDHSLDWEVTLAYTGEAAMTGARVARALDRYLGDAEEFAVTYGDGVTDADLEAELDFHRRHGKIGTVLGVNPPSRFGEFRMEGDELVEFVEKPELEGAWINGGYFFFRREFRDYLSDEDGCVLERDPLAGLARDRQLAVWRHPGFWACVDTQRDRDELNRLWADGRAPWRTVGSLAAGG
ncbi:MAG TPA: glucose-1-phosphate cytidylyltransferase [Gaiellaceae bacterium]|nr:glucose-1-phosphate cytidylyltransferase [Gaiellaceae bacterium]